VYQLNNTIHYAPYWKDFIQTYIWTWKTIWPTEEGYCISTRGCRETPHRQHRPHRPQIQRYLTL